MEKTAAFASAELKFEEFTQSALLSVAPELAKDGDPEYFTNKMNIQRYNYIHNTLKQVCGQSIPANSLREGLGYKTPKLGIGAVEESGLSCPISLFFKIGAGIQPEFIRADWTIVLKRDVKPDDYRDPFSEKTIRTATVYRDELIAPGSPDREVDMSANLRRRKDLNFLVRSLECYERNLFETRPERTTKKHHRTVSDEIGRAVTSLFSIE